MAAPKHSHSLRWQTHPSELRFATDALPWQRSLRWTQPLRDRRLYAIGLLIAALVTLLELVGFGLGMRAYPHRVVARVDTPIEVSLIDVTTPDIPPPPPEPEPPPIQARPSKIVITPPNVQTKAPPRAPVEVDPNAMSARIGDAGIAPPPPKPLLFNPDGSVRLDVESDRISVAPAAPKNPQEAAKARWVEMEKRGENPLHCKRTRFAKAFTPDQSAGDRIAGKYLKWIGLADPEAIAHRQQQREQRAEDGCDPAN